MVKSRGGLAVSRSGIDLCCFELGLRVSFISITGKSLRFSVLYLSELVDRTSTSGNADFDFKTTMTIGIKLDTLANDDFRGV